MKTTRVSKGGQVTLPAEVRHRWATDVLILEDLGNTVVLRPMPADPIAAAEGRLAYPIGMSTERARQQLRREEQAAEDRKYKRKK
jgi:bifunctional DNA-binding transcriptional regulator/antitoxin component of YhaV-PrlF toxin-antitoxin module